MKIIFYLTLTLLSLIWLKLGTDLQPIGTRGELDLCNLRESERGKVTGIVTKIKDAAQTNVTITDPNTGCSGIVTSRVFAQELKAKIKAGSILQKGVSVTVLVQGGFLKSPSNISLNDNLGTVVPYKKIVGTIKEDPEFNRNESQGIVEIWEQNKQKLYLYIPREQVKNIQFNKINTIYYNSNDLIVQIN
jgi:hypothetical protein